MFPPLPETNNRRSMVHIQDVIQAILCVAQAEILDDELFIVTGVDAPSGRQIYDQIRKAYGMRPIHIQVPRKLLYWLASICEILQQILRRKLPFNHEVLDRLLSSEWYSSKKLQSMLNWTPTVTLEMGLTEMAQDHSKSSFK
jgi:nucleoside-diphosphate-sugar epimerase